MKIKVDENLARAHKQILAEAGHDVADVHDEQLSGAADAELWTHVSAEGRMLVTLDTDFADIRRFEPGSHSGILLLRTPYPSLIVVSQILRRVLREGNLASLSGCLAVADETRTRIRRPRIA